MGVNRIHKKSGVTVSDIVNQTLHYEKAATAAVKDIAPQFKAATDTETMRNIWQFLRFHVPYKADGFKKQVIRLPYDLVRNGGDCKSYSLFTAAVLNNLGIPAKYKLTTYDPAKPNAAHIYIVANDGTIIDAVYDKFNDEKKPFTAKYYNTMTQLAAVGAHSAINGVFETAVEKTIKPQLEKAKELLTQGTINDRLVNNLRNIAVNGIPTIKMQTKSFFRGVRFIILFAFENNLNGIATKFANMDPTKRTRIYKLFYALGGNYQTQIWPIVNVAKNKPPTQVSTPYNYYIQLKNQGKTLSDFQNVWNKSAVGMLPPIETTGTVTGAGLVASILAFAAANPDLTKDIVDKVVNKGGNNTPPPPPPPDTPPPSNNLTTIGLAALAAKFLGVF